MNINELYWLAGILEGEGSFYIRTLSGHRYPTVLVKMTDRDIINRVKDITNLGTICIKKTLNQNHKDCYQWQVAKTADAVAVMKLVLPLMGERRSQRIKELLREFAGVV